MLYMFILALLLIGAYVILGRFVDGDDDLKQPGFILAMACKRIGVEIKRSVPKPVEGREVPDEVISYRRDGGFVKHQLIRESLSEMTATIMRNALIVFCAVYLIAGMIVAVM